MMPQLSVGDMASAFQTRRLTSNLKTDLTRLSTELATGKKSDLSKNLGGSFMLYSGIERSLKVIKSFETTNSEAETILETAQHILNSVQDAGQDILPALFTASTSEDVVLLNTTSVTAKQKLEMVVSSLNTNLADRTIFAGAASDGPALASAEEMLSELKTLTAGQTTATGFATIVEDWFDAPGGGFETNGYLGDDQPLGPFSVGENEEVSFSARADNKALRATLKGLAMTALLSEGAFAGEPTEQAKIALRSSEILLESDGKITSLRAEIGADQASVEDAKARNSAAKSSYEMTLSELSSVDPYDAATELEATYGQLETLYTITAKMASLKFTDYMR